MSLFITLSCLKERPILLQRATKSYIDLNSGSHCTTQSKPLQTFSLVNTHLFFPFPQCQLLKLLESFSLKHSPFQPSFSPSFPIFFFLWVVPCACFYSNNSVFSSALHLFHSLSAKDAPLGSEEKGNSVFLSIPPKKWWGILVVQWLGLCASPGIWRLIFLLLCCYN